MMPINTKDIAANILQSIKGLRNPIFVTQLGRVRAEIEAGVISTVSTITNPISTLNIVPYQENTSKQRASINSYLHTIVS